MSRDIPKLDPIFGPAREDFESYRDFTNSMKKRFCEQLAEHGNVGYAISLLNLKRKDVYAERRASEEFRAQWDEALLIGIDALEDEASRRAFQGVLEPVYYLGKVVGHTRKFSDNIAMFLLRGAKPEKYRERYEVQGHVTLEGKLKDLSDAELHKVILQNMKTVGIQVRTPETYEHAPQAALATTTVPELTHYSIDDDALMDKLCPVEEPLRPLF